MRYRRVQSALAVLATSLVSACSDVASVPPRFSATYVLERVNGRPLPAVATEGDAFRVTMIADTLVFHPDGEVERRSTVHYVGILLTTADTIVHRSVDLGYETDGSRLTILINCPANANCVGPSTGHINTRRIDLVDVGMGNAALHYTPR